MKKATGKKTREPSRASLREMPEVNFDKTKVRRNPYGLRIAREGISINAGRGRPRKGTETGRPFLPNDRRGDARGNDRRNRNPGRGGARSCTSSTRDRRRAAFRRRIESRTG